MAGTIVVGVDGSPRSADALALAQRLAALTGADLLTLTADGASPAQELQEAAEAAGAALIVVGPTRHVEPGRIGVGSVADRLLAGAPAPVAAAPAGYAEAAPDGFRRIGAAFTTREGSLSAPTSSARSKRRWRMSPAASPPRPACSPGGRQRR